MADDLKVKVKIDGDGQGLSKALGTAEKDLRALGTAGDKTKGSTEALNAAFAKLGIRSAKQIDAEFRAINQTIVDLGRNANVSGADFDRAWAAAQVRMKQLRGELEGTGKAADATAGRVDNMIGLMGGLGLAFSGAALAREFIRVNVELENTERTFLAITGSVKGAAAEMEYAKGVANRLGLEQIGTAKSYADLMAATKGTAAEGQSTRAVFEAVSKSMNVAGRSAAETQGALNALSQMASKGVVQMEELRGQLGERLPGALKAAADGFGLTTADLIKLTETGQLTAEELFPALADGLNKMYGATGELGTQTETLTQKWQHFKNGISDTFKTIGDAGALTALKGGLQGLETYIALVGAGFVALGQKIGVFLGGLASGDVGITGFSDRLKQAFADIESEAQDKLVKIALHNEAMVAVLNESGKKALAAAKAQEAAGAQTAAAGAAAQAAAGDWTRLSVAFAKLEDSGKKATEQATKDAEARKAEGEASVKLAAALGSETEKRRAKLDATFADAVATSTLAERRREELAIAQGHLEALEREKVAAGGVSEAKQKIIDDLKKTVEARQADADKAEGQARSSAVAAAAAQAESAAVRDNSKSLSELKVAADAAAISLEQVRAAKANGTATSNDVAKAEIAASEAAALYRDALNDQVTAIERAAQAKQSAVNIEAAGIKLDIERLKTMADVAKAYGDEATAAYYTLEAKRLEIQLAELTAKAKRAEAAASLLTIKAKREELLASGQLTVAKEAELKAQEAGARVKEIEAQIAEETADRMRQLADATASGATAADSAANSYDRLAKSLDGVKDSADGAGNGLSSVGVRGPANARGGSSQGDFTETLYRRGGSVEETKLAQKYVGELYARNQATMLTGNLGNEVNASRLMKLAINDAVDKALEAARKEIATGQAVDLGTSVGDLQARNLSKTPLQNQDDIIKRIKYAGNEAKAQVFRVDLRTSGTKTSSVNVASQADANNLISTLKDLQSRSA